MKKQKRQTPAPATLPTPSAAELMVEIENGHAAEVSARVQLLSQRDFVCIMRSVQTLERALSNYALSWQHAQYWGNGEPFPDEAETKKRAKVEAAGRVAHEVAAKAYTDTYAPALKSAMAES